jgi:hypothetical protein
MQVCPPRTRILREYASDFSGGRGHGFCVGFEEKAGGHALSAGRGFSPLAIFVVKLGLFFCGIIRLFFRTRSAAFAFPIGKHSSTIILFACR